jgi:hypothetical protein
LPVFNTLNGFRAYPQLNANRALVFLPRACAALAVLYPNWPARGQEPHRARGEKGNLADHNRVGARVADALGEAHAAVRVVGRIMPRGADVA